MWREKDIPSLYTKEHIYSVLPNSRGHKCAYRSERANRVIR